jgi:serine O-acetyltransferase
MPEKLKALPDFDPVWTRIRSEAEDMVRAEPLLGGLAHSSVLHHDSIECALAYRIALKLASGEMSEQLVREISDAAFRSDPDISLAARADIVATFDRDPACHRFLQPLLFFKGFQILISVVLHNEIRRQSPRFRKQGVRIKAQRGN